MSRALQYVQDHCAMVKSKHQLKKGIRGSYLANSSRKYGKAFSLGQPFPKQCCYEYFNTNINKLDLKRRLTQDTEENQSLPL